MMNDIFLRGFTTGLRQWRMGAIVYAVQLCLALTLGMQVYEVLKASIGHSLELHKLLQGYDHTVLTDFLNVHGASITPLIGELRWVLLVWLLFSVFLDGGLLYCAATPQEASWRAFWQGGAAWFFPFLKIALVFLALALVWSAAVLLPVAAFLEPALEYFPSEVYAVWGVLVLLAVWLSGLGVLLMWSVLSRLQRLRSWTSTVASLKAGGQVFRQHKARYFGLLAVFAGMQLALILLYWTLESFGGMTSPLLIVVFFGVQQAFVFLRILLRQMVYAAAAG